MALKSKRSSAGVSRGVKKRTLSFMAKMHYAGSPATKRVLKRRRAGAVETIEARLERKATLADTKTFASKSLGQMTREQRHELLFED